MNRVIQMLFALIVLTSCSARSVPSQPSDKSLLQRETDESAPTQVEQLPQTFSEQIPTHLGKPVAFDMILIPGDEERGIKPFYIAKTEVTWEMFLDWVYGEDLETALERAQAEAEGLRPSYLGHGHPQTELGLIQEPTQPAVGMSWRVAQMYCRWLSEQTGRTYRLPTDREWMYLLEKSGGIPESRAALLDRALLLDNNKEMDEPPFLYTPRPVAQGEPDGLGLYDLLGNAAEWVQPMGGKRWLRGGHFLTKADELSRDWLAFEDQAVWNESYPQVPVSESWYIDHFYQGIRLVCAIPVEQVDAPE